MIPQLRSDPNALLTRLTPLDPSAFLPSNSPVVDAARQRLQASQQDLMGQNMALQQEQVLRRQQQAQRLRMMRAIQAAQSVGVGGSPGLPIVPNGVLRNSSGAYSQAGQAPRGQVYNWINQALNITGHNGSKHDRLVNGLYQMIMHESGGNPTITNGWDSNAKAGTPSIGLMQTIQPTFNAYAIRGHRNIRNPVDNIIAGLRYALRNYGYGMVMGGGRHDASGNYLGY